MTTFQNSLKEFKIDIDKQLGAYFDELIEDSVKKDLTIAKALEQIKKIALAGGKRIRGALLFWAYLGAGGREKKKIMKIAVAIELIHLFFLVHDDIIDHGNLRHGEETIHELFSKKNNIKNDSKRAEHFGNSVAIIVGDMLAAKANEIILKAGFGDRETVTALARVQAVVATTIIGQSQDITIENSTEASEEAVLEMYENKTARYTFEGPLQLGVLFAGVTDKKTLQLLSQCAIPLGVAFQLQDDILGIFGEKEMVGKSTISDIEEGKQSVMVIQARKKASAADKKLLSLILGKKNLSQKEIQIFKDILTKTGAKEYAQNLAREYFKIGRNKIEKVVLLSASKNFLIGMADYLEKREV